ncbi:hypothetical protein BDF14DRAFT_1828905 [Spinellus fusiger]|nr:hypothetical protein BDF14DRAFT_1828905 [Spinellus fusiger]
MPAPIEYTCIRRMSTITVPKQDINFDSYDFQLCKPQNDIKNAFESRELEASFCRDFACCGLVLNDLHDLLQHYEECHVRFEDDESSVYDEPESNYWSPLSSPTSCSFASSDIGSPLLGHDESENISMLKKKAASYLSDLYNANTATASPASLSGSSSMSTPSSPISLSDDLSLDSMESFEDETPLQNSKKSQGKKRSYTHFSASHPNAIDLLTQSAAKKLALATGDLPTPILTDEDFLAQAGALLASANTNANADKPYKCPVSGCDKAYKNPNGLKYHNQHGHCNLVSDENENVASKPYQCTIGECGKRYKNLNGLKYHIEHSHMAALNHTLATFGSSFFASLPGGNASALNAIAQLEQAAAAAAAAVGNNASSAFISPETSPILSTASLPSLF